MESFSCEIFKAFDAMTCHHGIFKSSMKMMVLLNLYTLQAVGWLDADYLMNSEKILIVEARRMAHVAYDEMRTIKMNATLEMTNKQVW